MNGPPMYELSPEEIAEWYYAKMGRTQRAYDAARRWRRFEKFAARTVDWERKRRYPHIP